ncbi:hypothetical protein NP233_g3969 [Leucocoprinus birnbaumii]|uniref:Uncharacterized protein n=1 Tax=Leucocoprinus birnbaumii TaxID=56174 RepID=A0AAD5VRR4_9AGAR|nr:hypothetical protein NP233_g6013 [Leucocoprinus birnbaumii]KAJ3571106.1 hypothetical protein NP233_g3969 [Leucocoprinus birnbaumii]
MAVDRSLDIAELTALLLESLLYGDLLLCSILLIIAWFSKSEELPKKRYIIPIGALMLLLATSHLIIDFLRVLLAFVPKDPVEIADEFFKKLSHPYAILNWVLYALQTVLGDSVLVWRCFVFYDRRWWTLIPGIVLIGYNIASLVIVTRDLTFAVGAEFIHLSRPWMVSWISVTAALQLLYSLAIVFQILNKFRGVDRHVNFVLRAFVESCALYTLFALALLITFERASDADWVLLDMISPIVGISFCLIIIQLHIHFRYHDQSTAISISGWAVRRNIESDAITEFHPGEGNIKIKKVASSDSMRALPTVAAV